MLEVFDAGTTQTIELGPAEAVAVAGGKAAFLSPNGEINLWAGGASAVDLEATGTALAMSPSFVAALLTSGPDAVLGVYQIGVPIGSPGHWLPAPPGGPRKAVAVAVCGDMIAFISPELSGKRTIHLMNPLLNQIVDVDQAASEIVCNEAVVAFRTPEAQQGQDLNDDDDQVDSVLQAFDISRVADCRKTVHAPDCLVSSGKAATPCPSTACDPRFPYRVSEHSVRFLTFEANNCGAGTGCDFNNNGRSTDLLMITLALKEQASQVTGALSTVALGSCADRSTAVHLEQRLHPGCLCDPVHGLFQARASPGSFRSRPAARPMPTVRQLIRRPPAIAPARTPRSRPIHCRPPSTTGACSRRPAAAAASHSGNRVRVPAMRPATKAHASERSRRRAASKPIVPRCTRAWPSRSWPRSRMSMPTACWTTWTIVPMTQIPISWTPTPTAWGTRAICLIWLARVGHCRRAEPSARMEPPC